MKKYVRKEKITKSFYEERTGTYAGCGVPPASASINFLINSIIILLVP